MTEKCSENPKDCPTAARVGALEQEFNRYRDNSTKTHKEMFDRIRSLEDDRAGAKEKLDGIDEKLDKLINWREEQVGKPSKLMDKLKENTIWMVLAAILGVVLGRLGL